MHEDEGQAEEEKGSQRAGREEQGAMWLPLPILSALNCKIMYHLRIT